jgi:hypothetical protein
MEGHLIPARRLSVAGARLLIAGAALAILFAAADTRAQTSPAACEESAEVAVLSVPIGPWTGAPLRVIFAAEHSFQGELSLIAPDGTVAAKSRERLDGPPYSWFVEVAAPAAGKWRASLTRDGATGECATITREITVAGKKPPGPGNGSSTIWPVHNSWNRATENLYSAWLEKMFDDPLDAQPSWPALHEVLRDQKRNFLFNYLGLNEDQIKMVLRPDCADTPYFLRAYFAFKVGLPFGYSKCTRGGGGRGPHCTQWFSIQSPEAPRAPPEAAAPPPPSEGGFWNRTPPPPPRPTPVVHRRSGLVGSFGAYIQVVADAVHSGSARTALADNNTDQYPVALTQETLRPGTIYADPYGHVLTIVRRVPQTPDAAGIILAVDGQPDGTIARKRYWRGNFLFARDPALGGPGFKRFRPIVRGANGALRRLTNEEIAKNPQYADFSLDQSKLSIEDFYDRMDDVMSPSPLDPLTALKDAIASLDEQVKVRVQSVENGRKFLASGKGEASMPDGATIFETAGAWEDFSTPSRDLRMLIALDVVRGYPDRVARRPERYAMPAGKSAADMKAELESVLASELAMRKFSYTRTDGSQWTLMLKDMMERAPALEMAYNPNDCVELRWGAPGGSDEAATCKRHAPSAQRAKMEKYRAWFHERRRPPRA